MTTNHDNQAPGQDDNFAAGGEEFVFTEEKKPVNRNLLVLLLIAVVGGAAIYMMYLRNKGSLGTDSEVTRAKSEAVAEFMKKGDEDLKKLDEVLKNMDQQTSRMVADSSATQVKTEDLKTNPFQFGKETAGTPQAPTEVPLDPRARAEDAANKAEIQTIIFSAGGGSTCILNNKLCSEGDQITIAGVRFTLKQIAQDSVLLQAGKVGDFKVMVKAKGI